MAVKTDLPAAQVRAGTAAVEEVPVAEVARPPGIPLRTLGLFLVGAFAVGALLYYVGVEGVADLLGSLGWKAPLVLLPYALISFVDTLGWARAVSRHGRNRLSIWRLWCIRNAGEALSNVTPTAGLGGEPLKAFLLRRHGVDAGDGVASVVIAKTAIVCSQSLFTLFGLFLFLDWLGLLRDRAPMLFGVGVVALVICVVLVRGQRGGLAVRALRQLERIGVRRPFVRRLEQHAEAIDRALVSFYRDDPRGFVATTFYHSLGWILGAVEVMFLFSLMGVACDWRQAVIIESLTQATMAAAAVIPGGLGVQEISGTVLCRFLGLGDAAGAALMLLKRGREMAFTALGMATMSWLSRGHSSR